MESNLTQRTDAPEGYFSFESPTNKYSVVNFGVTMRTHPFPEGLYKGWEALCRDENNEQQIYRAESWEELYKATPLTTTP